MITNPQALENEILQRIKDNPDRAKAIPSAVAHEFVSAKLALQTSIIARDPLGMAGPQPLTPDQEAAAVRYERALNTLDVVTREEEE